MRDKDMKKKNTNKEKEKIIFLIYPQFKVGDFNL